MDKVPGLSRRNEHHAREAGDKLNPRGLVSAPKLSDNLAGFVSNIVSFIRSRKVAENGDLFEGVSSRVCISFENVGVESLRGGGATSCRRLGWNSGTLVSF